MAAGCFTPCAEAGRAIERQATPRTTSAVGRLGRIRTLGNENSLTADRPDLRKCKRLRRVPSHVLPSPRRVRGRREPSDLSEAVAESERHPVRVQGCGAQRRVRGETRVAVPRVNRPVMRQRNLDASAKHHHAGVAGWRRGEIAFSGERGRDIRPTSGVDPSGMMPLEKLS